MQLFSVHEKYLCAAEDLDKTTVSVFGDWKSEN